MVVRNHLHWEALAITVINDTSLETTLKDEESENCKLYKIKTKEFPDVCFFIWRQILPRLFRLWDAIILFLSDNSESKSANTFLKMLSDRNECKKHKKVLILCERQNELQLYKIKGGLIVKDNITLKLTQLAYKLEVKSHLK